MLFICEHNLDSLVSLPGFRKGGKTKLHALSSFCCSGGITTIVVVTASGRLPGVQRNSGRALQLSGKWVFPVMKREKAIMSIFGVPGQQNWVNYTLVTLEIDKLHLLLTTASCVTNKHLKAVQAAFCSEEKVENLIGACRVSREQGLNSKWLSNNKNCAISSNGRWKPDIIRSVLSTYFCPPVLCKEVNMKEVWTPGR